LFEKSANIQDCAECLVPGRTSAVERAKRQLNVADADTTTHGRNHCRENPGWRERFSIADHCAINWISAANVEPFAKHCEITMQGDINSDIVERARRAFPAEPVRTSYAIHLASALAVRSAVPGIELLSLDDRIRRAGQQLGFSLQPQ
jgi:hypothetical protein